MTKQDARKPAAQEGPARDAMELKAKAAPPSHPVDRTPDEGMNSQPNTGIAPSGALHAEGQRPVLERSRKVR
ncbi:MAG: hypothetical protein U1C74_27960 [Phenylobacterium sp.]|nr:hypothetical protein [Phenylobacterium sp.]